MNRIQTKMQVSAGGVAFRKRGSQIKVALISVGEKNRWQLPKGIVDAGESTESAAVREVYEETGLETEMIGPIDKVEYWYVSSQRGVRVRFHKFVYFYLLRYKAGDICNHDQEVNEARWVGIEEAQEMLEFASEKMIVERAQEMLHAPR